MVGTQSGAAGVHFLLFWRGANQVGKTWDNPSENFRKPGNIKNSRIEALELRLVKAMKSGTNHGKLGKIFET